MTTENLALVELCSVKQGRYLSPSEMSVSRTNTTSVPVIGGNGILGYTDKASNHRDVVLVTCRGSRCGLIQWVSAPVWVSNNAIACDTGSDLGNQLLRYLLETSDFSDVTTGSAQPQITIGHLSRKRFDVPPKLWWPGIVSTLSTVDRRIQVLRETNATLEAIAQALFKSWFVDFDPVRTKQHGLAPAGMDEATAALFPDRFEESASGVLPRGWQWIPFGQFLTHTIGGDWGSDAPDATNKTRVAIIRGTDIPDLQFGARERVPFRYTTEKKLIARRIEDGDLILEVSGGSKDQPTGRSIYLTSALLDRFDCPVEPASFCRLLRPRTKDLGIVLAQHLSVIYAQGKTWEYQNQSTGISNFQTARFLKDELVAIPPEAVLASFAATVRPMVDRAQLSQARDLATLRDTLLPRLISGQLRLPQTEAELETI